MSSGVRLGRIAGIEVAADVSVLLLTALVGWALYIDIVGRTTVDDGMAVAAAAGGAVLFVAGILVHELSHALVARRRNLDVAGIRLFVFGGYTEMDGDPPEPGDEVAIAIAGPLASLLLAGMFYVASLVAGSSPGIERALLALAVVNLVIAGFNVLPGLPLDGGRVLRALLWRRSGDRNAATRTAVGSGRIVGLGLVGVGAAVMLVARDPSGLWWALVGWLVYRTAHRAGTQERLHRRIEGMTAGSVMRPTPDPVPGEMPVGTVVDLFQIGRRLRSLPVEVDGRIRGVIGQQEVERIPPERHGATTAEDAMTRIGPGDIAAAEAPLAELFDGPGGSSGRLIVVREGRTVGIIEGEDLGDIFADPGR